MKKVQKIIKSLWIPMICGLLVIILLRLVLLIGYVPGTSMEPTIHKGSYIMGLRIHGELQRGDIVIFKLDGRTLVKRITGIPGDTVYVDEIGLYVMTPLAEDSVHAILTVPEGCYYLLGDNIAESRDSRYWEDPFIREEDILAKLLFP